MKSEFFVTRVTVCDQCSGSGVLHNPLFTDYYVWEAQLMKRTGKRDPELYETYHDEIHQWFADRGHPFNDWSELPPEEWECESCEGAGEISGPARLEDALSELGIEVLLLRSKRS